MVVTINIENNISKLQLIGKRILISLEKILDEKKFTKAELSERLNRSVTSTNKMLYDLKSGKSTLNTLLQLSEALEVDISKLFGEVDSYERRDFGMTNIWRSKIRNEVSQYPMGTIFELNKLLPTEWEPLTNSEKQQLGRDFYKEVLAGMYPNIRFHHKNSANHAYYEII